MLDRFRLTHRVFVVMGVFWLIFLAVAALGGLNPVIAGAAMAMSSVSVVSNALLLRRWRPGR